MILEAKYTGPFSAVTLPGYPRKSCKRGETASIMVRDGFPIGGDWKITKGKDKYEAALEKAKKEREQKITDRKKAKAEAIAKAEATTDKQYNAMIDNEVAGEQDTKKAKKTSKPEVKE